MSGRILLSEQEVPPHSGSDPLVVRYSPMFSFCRRLASDSGVAKARRGLASTVLGALPSPPTRSASTAH